MLFTGRCTIIINYGYVFANDFLSNFPGISYCSRTTYELGFTAIKLANPLPTPDEISQMAAEDTTVGMDFVDDDIMQILK